MLENAKIKHIIKIHSRGMVAILLCYPFQGEIRPPVVILRSNIVIGIGRFTVFIFHWGVYDVIKLVFNLPLRELLMYKTHQINMRSIIY